MSEPSFPERLLAARREHLADVEANLTYVPHYGSEECRLLGPDDEHYTQNKAQYLDVLRREITALEEHLASKKD